MRRGLIGVATAGVLVFALPAATTVIDIPAGLDLLVTLPGSTVNFEGPFEIPADFFGPGSDPFTGVVAVQGKPLQDDTSCQESLGPADTIIRRADPFQLADPPSSQTIDIEIVAMSLVSSSPITVTYNGGQDPELWNFEIVPLPPPPPPEPPRFGMLQLNRDSDLGGSFSTTHQFPVIIELTIDVSPPPPPKTFIPPQPDPFGGQGRWGIPATPPDGPQLNLTSTATLSCPPCKTDDLYLGFDGVQAEPFSLRGQFLNLQVIIPCTGAVPVEESTWGGVKSRYAE